MHGSFTSAVLVSSNVAFGAQTVPSEEVDAAFRMPAGKLRTRAGIISVARADQGDSEVTLGTRAAQGALRSAGVPADEIDCVLATTETHQAFPSLAAQLHRA